MPNSVGNGERGFWLQVALPIAIGLLLTLGIALGFFWPSKVNVQDRGTAANAPANSGDVARGKYLVEDVAMCGQCHTPRDINGSLDRSRWLQGAAVPFMPAQSPPNWPILAPRIGGTPPASDADMIKLLTTGIWTNGQSLNFPMMPFRMSEADARAVVAYLKTPTAW